MLLSMEQPSGAEPSSNASTFAGLLAALTAPRHEPPPAWNDDDLADDVATLTYERALRAHARYRPADFDDPPLPPFADSAGVSRGEPKPGNASRSGAASPLTTPNHDLRERTEKSPGLPATLEENRKRASITLRMSRGECAQLQQRAAEAGLTVSAYLRSCVFEAELLRAQVKEALAQLQPAKPDPAGAPPVARHSWFGWIPRIVSRRRPAASRIPAA